ncbi:MAG TPA: indole-3-glycerol phosphate synthase TrpC [Candidatus Hydrogenedentes bacterium]|nr:indole-3-glycerol phosphate synthase TrpC [Candidatus Hydrogenedentota bacterium]HOH42314.1 indole-3-glycerol phosphate synthase TrpC [Candidatus Hydrogenedentota bacterium]HOR50496.1 indole-3-glycerol phosphate synthase TrpC [Candidatus Hydrogenedentota bacterium]HPK24765.1 indole-3-glycerol phosphate synthase TrpC [Candidatus Hydrogenedentota bacterium]
MILDEIVNHKKEEILLRKTATSLRELEEQFAGMPAPPDFRAALRKPGISVIAEIKRRSPSRGDILPGVDAVEIAVVYEQAGARALSVLVDNKYFGGSLADLSKVGNHTGLPCLCKEFIIDPYQIYEARAAGAAAVLLIVRILTDNALRSFLSEIEGLGMAALVETHNEEEVKRALDAGASIIGINNRDLDTLEVDIETTFRMKSLVPGGNILVSESGIKTRKEVKLLEASGVDAILVGESLLTSRNIREKLESLLHDPED